MDMFSLGQTVRHRRRALGLTQERLAKMAKLSRRTIHELEASKAQTPDLGVEAASNLLNVLGLTLHPSLAGRQKKRGLWMAAKNASVSYKGELSPEMLERALATAVVPPGYEAHIGHFLDESPVDYVVMAVEEAAQIEARAPAEIWTNVARLAQHYSIDRKSMWA
ncbi:helix-turn-helix domain-containing protein [Caballeronia sp. LP003]|uniref:helix-turn-helix domain-containing protein n=1 Tax=Caballeronia sp. LP003 TaxID=3038551 RepID=UPI00285AB302|nr:helix-turn-helix domain-containing protein [Caballeronia sp. LP003]MDR5791685.1 helix-turn-helix domain-containing protein [Caballeronia sp. LP003]